jgi:hypothetical protein
MRHWLDEAAQGLAEGSCTRRRVIARGSGVLVGSTLVSLGAPLRALGLVEAKRCFVHTCPPGQTCCDNEYCYDPAREKCCPGGKGNICFRGDLCCGEHCCHRKNGEGCCLGELCCDVRAGETCCGVKGSVVNAPECCPSELHCKTGTYQGEDYTACCKSHESVCGEGHCYDPATHKCCGGKPCPRHQECCHGHCCSRNQECCGGKVCCAKGDCHDGICQSKACRGQRDNAPCLGTGFCCKGACYTATKQGATGTCCGGQPCYGDCVQNVCHCGPGETYVESCAGCYSNEGGVCCPQNAGSCCNGQCCPADQGCCCRQPVGFTGTTGCDYCCPC